MLLLAVLAVALLGSWSTYRLRTTVENTAAVDLKTDGLILELLKEMAMTQPLATLRAKICHRWTPPGSTTVHDEVTEVETHRYDPNESSADFTARHRADVNAMKATLAAESGQEVVPCQ